MSKRSPAHKRPDKRVSTVEDLTQTMRDKGAKVRMRVVIEVVVSEETFNRDGFNDTVVEWSRTLENFDSGDGSEIVLLTTEELTPT